MQQAAFSFSSLLLPAVEAKENSEKHRRMEESRSMFRAVQTEAKLKKRGSKCLHLRHRHILGVLHHLQRPSSANVKKFPTHTHTSQLCSYYLVHALSIGLNDTSASARDVSCRDPCCLVWSARTLKFTLTPQLLDPV